MRPPSAELGTAARRLARAASRADRHQAAALLLLPLLLLLLLLSGAQLQRQRRQLRELRQQLRQAVDSNADIESLERIITDVPHPALPPLHQPAAAAGQAAPALLAPGTAQQAAAVTGTASDPQHAGLPAGWSGSRGDAGPAGGGGGSGSAGGGAQRRQRQRIRAFVGVFTGFNGAAAANGTKYNYALRRQALRETWFPGSRQQLDWWEQQHGVVLRFVVGHSGLSDLEAAMDGEAARHGDIMRLPGLREGYGGLPNKTRTYFRAVGEAYDADWIVKMDDDVFLAPQRLLAAASQWDRMGAGYVGCMKHGVTWTRPGTRWFEPAHLLIGATYYLHAYGSIYALSGRVVQEVVVANFGNLRMLSNEDTSVGAWMLGHQVRHFEDMRLCSPHCSLAAVAVLRNECAGLCSPVEDMYAMHANLTCRAAAPSPLPYARSHPEHRQFEQMWV